MWRWRLFLERRRRAGVISSNYSRRCIALDRKAILAILRCMVQLAGENRGREKAAGVGWPRLAAELGCDGLLLHLLAMDIDRCVIGGWLS